MSSKKSETPGRPRGRPIGHDPDAALEAAMRQFWAMGYEAASIGSLCQAMKIPRATLYQRFGGKDGLFLAALDRYGRTRVEPLIATLGPIGTLEEDLGRFFDTVIALATSDPPAKGCLISCVLCEAAGGNARFQEELDRRFAALEAVLANRIRAEPGPDSDTDTADAQVRALLLASVARGLMVRARSDCDVEELFRVGRAAAALGRPGTAAVPATALQMQ